MQQNKNKLLHNFVNIYKKGIVIQREIYEVYLTFVFFKEFILSSGYFPSIGCSTTSGPYYYFYEKKLFLKVLRLLKHMKRTICSVKPRRRILLLLPQLRSGVAQVVTKNT